MGDVCQELGITRQGHYKALAAEPQAALVL